VATLGEDRTIFFFKIDPMSNNDKGGDEAPILFSNQNVQVTPIGFIEMESQPLSISFSPDNHLNDGDVEANQDGSSESLLATTDDGDGEESGSDSGSDAEEIDGKRAMVVLKDGSMLSLIVPPLSKVDTKITYCLDQSLLQVKQWNLEVPQKLPPKEEQAKTGSQANLEGGTSSTSPGTAAVSTKTPTTAKTTDTKNKDKDGGNNTNQNAPRLLSALRKDRGLVIAGDSPFTSILYLDGGYFLVALTNKFGEGEIRSCKFGSPNMSR
jgi:hypothetical protein